MGAVGPQTPALLPAARQLDYLWAALIARIYEVFPLICPMCASQMRIIAFITFSADIHKILDHIGVDPEAPRIAPARGPPLWDDCAAQETGEGVNAMPDWEMTANQHRTTPTISVHTGEPETGGEGSAGGRLWPWAAQRVVCWFAGLR